MSSGDAGLSTQATLRRAVACAGVGGSALLLLLLALPMLAGRIQVADDLGAYHLPARAFYAECLARGQAFDWWPQVFGGTYLTGEGQAGTYHPLHALLYRWLPLSLAFGLEVWLSYPFLLLGSYLWLRSRLARPDLAAFGALTFTFCAFNLLHLVHVNAIAIVAHIPWLLWSIDRLLERRGRWLAGVAPIATLTGSQLLLGYPQYVWLSLLAQACYIVVRRAAPGGAVRIAVAGLIGLAIGAVQWLPTVDALGHSVRQDVDAAFQVSGSLHPLNLLQTVAPYLFATRVFGDNTHEFALYPGAVPLTLIAWLFCRGRRPLPHRRLALFCFVLAVLGLWLALGKHGGLYRIQTWLPLVDRFRNPCRTSVLLYLATAAGSAIALGALLHQPSLATAATRSGMRGAWGVLVLALAVALIGPRLWPERVNPWPWVALGPLLFGLAAWLIGRAQRGAAWAALGLVLLTAADLGGYGLSYAALRRVVDVDSFVAATDRPPGPIDGRVALDSGRRHPQSRDGGNRVTLTGWSRIDGYLGLTPHKQLDYHDGNALRAANVHWIADIERVEHGRWIADYRKVERPLPAVRLLTHAVTCADPAAAIATIRVDDTALVDSRLDLLPADPGVVSIVREQPGVLCVHTRTSTAQLLTVAQSFHVGWRARVDDQEVAIRRVYGDFMGCLVPTGDHDVTFVFRPRSLRDGRRLSLVGVGLLLCCLLAACHERRARPGVPQ